MGIGVISDWSVISKTLICLQANKYHNVIYNGLFKSKSASL